MTISFKTNKDYPYVLDINEKPLSKKSKDDITSRVKALFLHKAATVVLNGTDSIIISVFLSLKTLGLYMNYYYISYLNLYE